MREGRALVCLTRAETSSGSLALRPGGTEVTEGVVRGRGCTKVRARADPLRLDLTSQAQAPRKNYGVVVVGVVSVVVAVEVGVVVVVVVVVVELTGLRVPSATALWNTSMVSGPTRPSAVTPRSVWSFATAVFVASE